MAQSGADAKWRVATKRGSRAMPVPSRTSPNNSFFTLDDEQQGGEMQNEDVGDFDSGGVASGQAGLQFLVK